MKNLNIVWSDEFAIGIAQIDEQHQQLFSLVNQISLQKEKPTLQYLYMQLYKYTREHFHAEEEVMKAASFPGYHAHKAIHDEIISQLNELSNTTFESNEKKQEFDVFLANWLITHVMSEDKEIGRFLATLADEE